MNSIKAKNDAYESYKYRSHRMSFIKQWFEDRRTSAEKRYSAEKDTRYYTKTSNHRKVIDLITAYVFDINKECIDDCDNTLLHTAVQAKCHVLAESFVIMGADVDRKNYFSKSPMDIAVSNNDTKMIRILFKMETMVQGLKIEREKLQEQFDVTVKENVELKSGKRKRCDDCDVLDKEIKKIKKENTNITEQKKTVEKDNAELKTSIESLRASFKN